MLLRRAASGAGPRGAAGRGPVLGPVRGASYSDGRVEVAPGDILMMYTDGLVERRGRDVETGISEVQRAIADWGISPYATACRDLADALAPRPRGDDVCILAVRFTAAD
ncbi:MAG: SpoIIE family protein phosphatase [Planctomycetota bacterium]